MTVPREIMDCGRKVADDYNKYLQQTAEIWDSVFFEKNHNPLQVHQTILSGSFAAIMSNIRAMALASEQFKETSDFDFEGKKIAIHLIDEMQECLMRLRNEI